MTGLSTINRHQRACLLNTILPVFLVVALRFTYLSAQPSSDNDALIAEIRDYIPLAREEAISACLAHWRNQYETAKPIDTGAETPEYGIRQFFGSSPIPHTISLSAVSCGKIRDAIKYRFNLSDATLKQILLKIDGGLLKPYQGDSTPDQPLETTYQPALDFCPYAKAFNCSEYFAYRSQDGSCNSLTQPIMGRMMTPYRRLLPPQYGDGYSTPRLSACATGGPLPSARLISSTYLRNVSNPSPLITLVFTSFGQIVSHDLMKTAQNIFTSPDGPVFVETRVADCGADGCNTTGGNDPCFPIPVPSDDPNFTDRRCLRFVRSTQVLPLDCSSDHVEQINQVTHWLDGSPVYGSSLEETRNVRDNNGTGSQLRTVPHPQGSSYKPMLPPSGGQCPARNFSAHCFLAGDGRVNQNGGLAVMQTMWARQHNSIAAVLASLNEHWNSEKVFQETRRIIVAMLQHITYNEYLPLLVGYPLMQSFQLTPRKSGYFEGYNGELDSRLSVEFISAAYRFGHSMIDPKTYRVHGYQVNTDLFLSSTFLNPQELFNTEEGGVDGFVRGSTVQSAQSADRYVTDQLTVSLFTRSPPHGLGTDLPALNIQRGRDHGVASYNDHRPLLGLKKAESFEDFYPLIPRNRTYELKQLYKHVDDVDLFVGGLSEVPAPGAAVGRILGLIIAETFNRLKFGDRFFYESKTAGFSMEQLKAIRSVSMRDILCNNGDSIPALQASVFLRPDVSYNRFVPCSSSTDINLSAWDERQHH